MLARTWMPARTWTLRRIIASYFFFFFFLDASSLDAFLRFLSGSAGLLACEPAGRNTPWSLSHGLSLIHI